MSKEKSDKEWLIDYKLPHYGKRTTSTSSQTSTAKSESSNTTYQTATIVNNIENKIIFQTRRQTVYTQQIAGVTEIITTKHTPTMDELNEMMDLLNTDCNPTNNNNTETDQTQTAFTGGKQSEHRTFRTESFRKQQSGKTTHGSPKVASSYETKKSNGGKRMSSPSSVKEENISSTAGNESRSRSSSSSSNSGLSTPTLITTQETIVTEQNHTTYTENKQEQLIKLNKSQAATEMTFATKYSSKSEANQSKIQSITSEPYNAKDQLLACTNDVYNSNNTIDSTNQLLNKALSQSQSQYSVTKLESSSQLKVSSCDNSKASKPSLTISGKQIVGPLLKPGIAYIFNSMIFEDSDDSNNAVRIGSAADVFALKDAFQFYDLQVTVIDNANLERIRATAKIIQEMDFSSYSCLAVVILSHGSRNEEINDNDLLSPTLSNPTLKNKAKIFCIQSSKSSRTKDARTVRTTAKLLKGSDDKLIIGGITSAATDLLICHSILEGSVFYRSERGSIFIQILSKCLKLYGSNKNIKDIMEMVINIVKQQTNYRQIPELVSSLTQPFVFGDYVKFSSNRYKLFQSL